MGREQKNSMVRLALVAASLTIDSARVLTGRGGYLHARRECLERFAAARSGRIRSLGCEVTREQRRKVAAILAKRLDGGVISE